LKKKNTGSKSHNLKLASKKVSSSNRDATSKDNNSVKTTEASRDSKRPLSSATLKAVAGSGVGAAKSKEKTVKTVALAVAQRMSSAKLAKKPVVSSKNSKTNLKLVAKGEASIPATKITRSSPTSPGSKVLSGSFGGDTSPAKSVVAVRTTLERSVEKMATTTAEISFKTGDKIVYPGHGVGEVEGIRTTSLGGQEHYIYNIKILDSGMKVMVPVSQAAAVGLRRIVDKREIERVFEILRDRDFKIDTQTWNRRFREYSQKIKTGSVYEIAIVLRDLSVLSADKELSFGEKKMLDMAEALLVSEIALAKARPADKVVGELRALFA
jgi:CarD family transcriptional regulator